MSFLSMGLTQECTYWQVIGKDGYNEPTFASPVELSCRWEQRTEKVQTNDGEELVSKARVFLADDVSEGDYLAFGSYVTADPRTIRLAFEVMVFRKTPSLDGSFFGRKAYV